MTSNERKARDKAIRKMRREGLTLQQIGKLVGLTLNRVWEILQGPEVAFRQQRRHARDRGIGFELTFSQWMRIWDDSGHYADRGRGYGCYVMARHNDEGDYAVGNVSIILAGVNVALGQQGRKRSSLPLGVYHHGKKFQARRMIDGERHNLGTFRTPRAASAAYLAAG